MPHTDRKAGAWVAMDLFHGACAIHFAGNGAPEAFTPFVRIVNSYNASRAVRLDVGFMRGVCSNGMIFAEQVAKIRASHTAEGISRLKISQPFGNMGGLVSQFSSALAAVRAVNVSPDQASEIVRQVIGWPNLPERATDRRRDDLTAMEMDLKDRRDRYFAELGSNAYAVFIIVTDLASHPPVVRSFLRGRPALERAAGAWLRSFVAATKCSAFSVDGHTRDLSLAS